MLKTLISVALAAACIGPTLAQGQNSNYPAKPVRFIPASPGSPQDLIGRIVGQKLSEHWMQPVFVENRAGAGGLLSITSVVQSPADGYTVLVTSSTVAVSPFLYAKAGYDAEKDLLPVILLASTPNILVAHPGLGISSFKDIIERAGKGHLHFGSPGYGTTPHLSAEYVLNSLAGLSVTHVPYKTAGQVVAAVVAGEVPLAGLAVPVAASAIRSGKLRGILVTSSRRAAALPDVPAIPESGFAQFEDVTWVGIMVPARSAQSLVSKIHADADNVLSNAEVRGRLSAMGFEPMGGTPQEFSAYLKKELAKWEKVVKVTGARAE